MKTTKKIQPNSLMSVKSFTETSDISRNIAEHFKSKSLIEFSSRDIYLQFRIKSTKNCVDVAELDIISNKEYANDYHGVIGFELESELLEQLHEDVGKYFIEMVNRVAKNANIILYVPVNTIESKKTYLLENVNNLEIAKISEVEYAKQIKSI